MSTAPFHAALASPVAIRRDDDLALVEWEVEITSFSGLAYLDTPWRALAGRLAFDLNAALVGDVTVTIGCRAYSLVREPLRFRFATRGGASDRRDGAPTRGAVHFELGPEVR